MSNSDDKKTKQARGSSKSSGYGRPPEANRFQKGVSGNPRGRPKGSLNLTRIFIKAASEKVVINENGQRRTVTKLTAAAKQLVNKAASGELRAFQVLRDWLRDVEARQNPSVVDGPLLNELDDEVLKGLLHRFTGGEFGKEEQQEEAQEEGPEEKQEEVQFQESKEGESWR